MRKFQTDWIEYTVPGSTLVVHAVFPPSGSSPALALLYLRWAVSRSIWQDGNPEWSETMEAAPC